MSFVLHVTKMLFVAMCMLTVVLPTSAIAQNFKHSWSGSGRASQDADSDGSMSGGIVGSLSGAGTFGRGDTTIVLDSEFGGFCDTSRGPSTGILLNYIAFSAIMRSARGDLLFRNLSSSPPSSACIDLNASTGEAEIYLDVVGGTGKFEQAYGSTRLTYTIYILSGQNGISGSETGEVHGVRGNGR